MNDSPSQCHYIDYEALERQLTAALVALWKAQGKRKKIVALPPLPPVDTGAANVVVLQQ